MGAPSRPRLCCGCTAAAATVAAGRRRLPPPRSVRGDAAASGRPARIGGGSRRDCCSVTPTGARCCSGDCWRRIMASAEIYADGPVRMRAAASDHPRATATRLPDEAAPVALPTGCTNCSLPRASDAARAVPSSSRLPCNADGSPPSTWRWRPAAGRTGTSARACHAPPSQNTELKPRVVEPRERLHRSKDD